ncbi:helix-hairpin-helix domain-containing protein [Zoogloea dura]|jgi:competence ComEA-like helix-hairpin-helix protein|uniref:Helix-hairpin-helix domain-containing protein n=1 Tax=Zoogloea dura TaxID=2728840 RepID=A0A848G294_9RHOO|nr:helix-hairpin-helix domain-containing protein [Zoogloea dura]NML26338.1 helix-hairpin-helix domain-containing protein [Zoogloea dura]
MTTFQTLQAPLSAASSAIRIGFEHGYAFDGDRVRLDAELLVDDPAAALGQEWALQLWACDTPFDGRPVSAAKIAEIPLAAPGDSGTTWFSASTDAFPPAGRADHNLVLILAAGQDGCFAQVQDYVNFPRAESFMQPRLDGTSSFSLAEDGVTMAVERISNPRTEDNLSGSLALELWALPAPYQAGEPEGQPLVSVALGSLAGQQAWQDLAFTQALATHPAGTWHIALLLREWSAKGYVTRDFSNFPLPVTWNAAPAAAAPAEEAPAAAAVTAEAPAKAAESAAEPAAGPSASKAKPAAKPKAAAAAAAAPASVSINTATAAELAAVKGLSKAVAAAIVAARPFKSLDELVGVKGMGVKSFDKLKGSLSL